MPGASTGLGLVLVLFAVGVLVLVGLIYLGGRKERPPAGSERETRGSWYR